MIDDDPIGGKEPPEIASWIGFRIFFRLGELGARRTQHHFPAVLRDRDQPFRAGDQRNDGLLDLVVLLGGHAKVQVLAVFPGHMTRNTCIPRRFRELHPWCVRTGVLAGRRGRYDGDTDVDVRLLIPSGSWSTLPPQLVLVHSLQKNAPRSTRAQKVTPVRLEP